MVVAIASIHDGDVDRKSTHFPNTALEVLHQHASKELRNVVLENYHVVAVVPVVLATLDSSVEAFFSNFECFSKCHIAGGSCGGVDCSVHCVAELTFVQVRGVIKEQS